MQLELLYPQIFEKLEKIDEKQDLAQDEARDFRDKIARVEAVICPDPITGQKSMGQRVAAIESAVLTANIGWRTLAKVGGLVVLCASGAAWLLDKAITLFGGAPPHH